MNDETSAEEAPAVEADAERFRCPSCGAEITFDVTEQEGEAAIVEYDLEHGLAQSRERGLGVEVRSARCGECGATVSFGQNVTATACDFCGSAQVLEQQGNRQLLRPESLVSFQVDGKSASGAFSTWLGKLWFRPSDLKRRAGSVQMNGVYVPYWTFDARVDSSWTAQSGTHYTVRVGKTTVRKTRWRWTSGRRSDAYDDLLVCGSRGLPTQLADKLRTFDTAALVPYRPDFLAGWKAEEYAVDLNEAWAQAVSKMQSTQRSRCAQDVPGDTHRFLKVENRFSDETFKHVLLPIWISSYRYRETLFRFLVNGQTGEVTGQAPWSVVKIALAVLFVLALAAGAFAWFQSR